jgi:hypothetical protein
MWRAAFISVDFGAHTIVFSQELWTARRDNLHLASAGFAHRAAAGWQKAIPKLSRRAPFQAQNDRLASFHGIPQGLEWARVRVVRRKGELQMVDPPLALVSWKS